MKKSFWTKHAIPVLAALTLLAGCATPERPADITVDELEARMTRVMDPAGKYAKSYAYLQRQNTEEDGIFSTDRQAVEIRFQRPDKFKFTYYDDKNHVRFEIISSKGRAWSVDYDEGIVSEIIGGELAKLQMMLELGHPDTDFDKLYDRIEMTVTTIEDENEEDVECFKLVCHPKNLKKDVPVTLYVDCNRALPILMEVTVNGPDGPIKVTNWIREYKFFDGVFLPSLSVTSANDREFRTRIVGYMLNPHFEKGTFDVPKFDPVMVEVRKKQLKED